MPKYSIDSSTLTDVADAVRDLDGNPDTMTPAQMANRIRAFQPGSNTAIIADDYDATATYDVGEYCIYDGGLYVCNTAISTAEAWTVAHWTEVTVGDELSDLKSDLNDILVNGGAIEPVTLTNQINVETFWQGSVTLMGFEKTNYVAGVAKFTSTSRNEKNPYMAKYNLNLPSGKWLFGVKLKITKIDSSLGNPESLRLYYGSTKVATFEPTWGEWVNCYAVANNDSLNNINIYVFGFAIAPTAGQFTFEIKDMYLYKVDGVSDDATSYIVEQQANSYQDGTVTYGGEASYTPDASLSIAGKAADSKAVGDAIQVVLDDVQELSNTVESIEEDMQSIDDIKSSMDTLFNYESGQSVTLVNQDSLANIVGMYAATQVSYIDGVKTFTFGDGSQVNPAIAHSNMSLSSDKWMVGFKYRLTKLDQNVGTPADFRVLFGSDTYTDEIVLNEWVEFNKVITNPISRVYITVRGFNPAPTSGQFQIEIKDYYIYDVSDLDAQMLDYVQSKQNTTYEDGTVTYKIEASYTPDTTLDEEGKCADSKAVGDAIGSLDSRIGLTSQVLTATMQNKRALSNLSAIYGLKRDLLLANLAVYSPSSSPNISPAVNDSCSLGEKTWLVGFKYRITKNDQSLGDPECARLILGATDYIDYNVVYDTWMEVAEIKTVDLTQVYFLLRNYTTAPTTNQLKLEIKDYYVYDISDLSGDMVQYILDKQSTNYTDGTVIYTTYVFSDKLRSSLDVINVKQHGVVGDGVTDDTDAIRNLFASYRGKFYFPSGTYKITGTIELFENSTMYGDGDDTVIDMHSCDHLADVLFNQYGNWKVRPYILVQSENVTIRKIKLIGNDTLQEQRHAGILFTDTKNCTVEDTTIYNINFDANQDDVADVSGYGICVNRSKYVTVERIDARRCGYECIGIVFECDYCVVRDCYTQDGWRTCIQVHRETSNTVIENCYMKQTHTKYHACFTVHGLENQEVKNLSVINCTIECTQNGAQPNHENAPVQIMSYSQRLVFFGNRVFGGKRSFYITSNSNNAKIIGNDFNCNSTSDYGVTIGSTNTLLIGNCLVNNADTPVNNISNNPVISGNIGIS